MASPQGQAGFQGSLGCVQAQGHLLHALCAQLEEFLGEFPHLAKAEPSSSNTCSKACAAQKLPHLLRVWDLSSQMTFISGYSGKKKLKNFTTEFWRLQEQTGGRNPTTNSAWDLFWMSQNAARCGSAAWSALHFLTGHLSTSCHPLQPSANFGETQKGFLATRKWFKFGELCLLLAVLTWKSFYCSDLVPPQQNLSALGRKSIYIHLESATCQITPFKGYLWDV